MTTLPGYNDVPATSMTVLTVFVAYGPTLTITELANRISIMGERQFHHKAIRSALGPLVTCGYISIQPTKTATRYHLTSSGQTAGKTWYQEISHLIDALTNA